MFVELFSNDNLDVLVLDVANLCVLRDVRPIYYNIADLYCACEYDHSDRSLQFNKFRYITRSLRSDGVRFFKLVLIISFPSRHFQLNPILILEFDIGVRIMFLVDILKDNM